MKAVKHHIKCPNTSTCGDDYFIVVKIESDEPKFCPLCGESINVHDDSYEGVQDDEPDG